MSRGEGFDYDVGPLGEFEEDPPPLCFFDVEGDSPFTGVVIPEGKTGLRRRDRAGERTGSPGGFPAGPFHFDDGGPQIGQEPGAEAGRPLRQVKDLKGVQEPPRFVGCRHTDLPRHQAIFLMISL